MAYTFSPDTEIYLLNVPLNNDGANTLTFGSKQSQFSYFSERATVILHRENYTYQRKDGTIRVNANAESLWGVNYAMYKNKDFGNRWFYAFAEVEYVNPSVSNIKLTTDYWQTFAMGESDSDFKFGKCRIEREIISKADDIIFSNSLPEPLSAGEYFYEGLSMDDNPLDYEVGGYIIASQVNIQLSPARRSGGGTYNGTYYPLTMYAVDNPQDAVLIIDAINAVYDSGINYVTAIPKMCFDRLIKNNHIIANTGYLTQSSITVNLNSHLNRGDISGYNIKNKKSYNFTSLFVTNNADATKEYDLCLWAFPTGSESNYSFSTYANIGESNSVMFVPVGYMVASGGQNFDMGFQSQPFPTMAYSIEKSNYFALQQEMARNSYEGQVNQARINTIGTMMGTATTIASAGLAQQSGSGAGTGAMMGGASSGLSGAFTDLGSATKLQSQAENFDLQRAEQYYSTPYQFGGLAGATSVMASAGFMCPRFYWKVPRYEEIRAIDTFFDMYGYNVSRTARPQIHRRSKWDYCKCSNVTIENQNMPQEAVDYIKKCMMGGMTFWHDPATMYDYTQTNSDAS